MCLMCDGWSYAEVLEQYVADIDRHGWAVVAVERGRDSPAFAYTVGLTRFHDHPELVVSGLPMEDAGRTLDALAGHVREGHRYRPGDVVVSLSPHRYQLLRVTDPRRLVLAQEIYGERGARLVPGLQLAWTNHAGQWPWDTRWASRLRDQQLFGRPLRAAT